MNNTITHSQYTQMKKEYPGYILLMWDGYTIYPVLNELELFERLTGASSANLDNIQALSDKIYAAGYKIAIVEKRIIKN
jgi:hypothetical protein